MQCPVCKASTFATIELEPTLRGYRCSSCHGTWIDTKDYWHWRQQQLIDRPHVPSTDDHIDIVDTDDPKVCPSCQHLLLPYRVGHGVAFSIDHCGHCGGNWLDRNEWEALRRRNLHDNLHQMFGAPWQSRVRQEEHKNAMERIYRRRFGDSDYAELQRLREWLREHPQRDLVLAYLINPDPYKRS